MSRRGSAVGQERGALARLRARADLRLRARRHGPASPRRARGRRRERAAARVRCSRRAGAGLADGSQTLVVQADGVLALFGADADPRWVAGPARRPARSSSSATNGDVALVGPRRHGRLAPGPRPRPPGRRWSCRTTATSSCSTPPRSALWDSGTGVRPSMLDGGLEPDAGRGARVARRAPDPRRARRRRRRSARPGRRDALVLGHGRAGRHAHAARGRQPRGHRRRRQPRPGAAAPPGTPARRWSSRTTATSSSTTRPARSCGARGRSSARRRSSPADPARGRPAARLARRPPAAGGSARTASRSPTTARPCGAPPPRARPASLVQDDGDVALTAADGVGPVAQRHARQPRRERSSSTSGALLLRAPTGQELWRVDVPPELIDQRAASPPTARTSTRRCPRADTVVTAFGVRVHPCLADALDALMTAALADGIELHAWGWRSASQQIALRAAQLQPVRAGRDRGHLPAADSAAGHVPPRARPRARLHRRAAACCEPVRRRSSG